MQFYEFGEWEFYDLETDPDELTNLYDNPEYADRIESIKSGLEALRAHYGDDTVGPEKPEQWQKDRRANRWVVPSTL